jgi:hypothetical protein
MLLIFSRAGSRIKIVVLAAIIGASVSASVSASNSPYNRTREPEHDPGDRQTESPA